MKDMSRDNPRKGRLTVLAVLLLVLTVNWIWCLFPYSFGARQRMHEATNRTMLSQLRAGICIYTEQYESLPPEMAALVRDSRGVRYIAHPVDAWGKALVYRLNATGDSVEIWCLGRDHLPGGEGTDADSGYRLSLVPGSPGTLKVTPLGNSPP